MKVVAMVVALVVVVAMDRHNHCIHHRRDRRHRHCQYHSRHNYHLRRHNYHIATWIAGGEIIEEEGAEDMDQTH